MFDCRETANSKAEVQIAIRQIIHFPPAMCFKPMARLLQGGREQPADGDNNWLLLWSCSWSQELIYALAFSLLIAHLTGK